MRWVLVLVYLFCLGCVASDQTPPRFGAGDFAYHKLDGKKIVIRSRTGNGGWYGVYSDQLGEIHSDYFPDTELSETPPR